MVEVTKHQRVELPNYGKAVSMADEREALARVLRERGQIKEAMELELTALLLYHYAYQ